MLETMQKSNGIGLAAPQIGVSKRVIVMDITPELSAPYAMVNPEIVWESDEYSNFHEGCLSIPDRFVSIDRPKQVIVKYIDGFDGKHREIQAEGLLATCVQHEIDHLNGILIIDKAEAKPGRSAMSVNVELGVNANIEPGANLNENVNMSMNPSVKLGVNVNLNAEMNLGASPNVSVSPNMRVSPNMDMNADLNVNADAGMSSNSSAKFVT